MNLNYPQIESKYENLYMNLIVKIHFVDEIEIGFQVYFLIWRN